MDKYEFIVLGGQHAVKAAQELIEQKDLISKDPAFDKRTCIIYRPMSLEAQLQVGIKHQETAENVEPMLFQDKVRVPSAVLGT